MEETVHIKDAECLVASYLSWIDKVLFNWNYMYIHLLKAQGAKPQGFAWHGIGTSAVDIDSWANINVGMQPK